MPSIKFRYGKRVASSESKSSAATSTLTVDLAGYAADQAQRFPTKATRTYLALPPMFGRPPLSAAEIQAIETGGAY